MRTHSKDTSARVLRLTYSALYLAIALVLPFLTGQIPQIGSMLCPMHIPALLCGVAVAAALRLPFPTAVMTVILPLLFTLLQACFGLFVNLLHPNLTWVSEMTPIKQSLGVLFSLLGGWGYAALLGIGGYFLTVPVPAWVALLALNLLTALLSLLLLRWLKGRGARIFATL